MKPSHTVAHASDCCAQRSCSHLGRERYVTAHLQVEAVLAGQPLPPPSEQLVSAWEAAKREAIKSEYAFKPGLVRISPP